MSGIGVLQRDYSGFFPFNIGPVTAQLAAGNSLLTQMPLATLSRLWWASKTFDWSANLAYSVPIESGGGDVDAGNAIGSGSGVACFKNASSASTPPAQRIGSTLPPFVIDYVPPILSSGSINYTTPVNYTNSNVTSIGAGFKIMGSFFDDNGRSTWVGVDAAKNYYANLLVLQYLYFGAGVGTGGGGSLTAGAPIAGFSSAVAAIFNLTIDGLLTPLPLSCLIATRSSGSNVVTGGIGLNINTFFTSPTT